MALIFAVILCLLPLPSMANSEISATLLLDPQFRPPNNQLIVVDLSRRTLRLYYGDRLIKGYRVAIGKPETPTPVGKGYIRSKGRIIFKYESGPRKGQIRKWSLLRNGKWVRIPYSKMFGLGITVPGYNPYQFYIHSTTEDYTMGQAASSGCVRMRIKDMLELYPLVELGARIIIKP